MDQKEYTYNRAWVLGDVHWGIYPGRYRQWLEMMNDFFQKEFIPYLRENVKEGDVLIQVGDWFHSQKSIDILAMNYAMENVLEIAQILPVHMLVGNHDIWGKADVQRFNSLKAYNYFPNVHLHQKPHLMTIGAKKTLLMPWFHKKDREQQCLKDHVGKADIVFCHSDLVGSRTTLRKDLDSRKIDIIAMMSTGHGALDLADFDGYETVYSGHIHIRHRYKNFQFVGTPYQLDTNDMDNDKGWWLLDPDNDVEDFIPNKLSPQFKHFHVSDLNDMKSIDPDVVSSNYSYLFIDASLLTDKKIRKEVNKIMHLPWKERTFVKPGSELEKEATSKAFEDIKHEGPVVLDRKTTFNLTNQAISKIDIPDAEKDDMRNELNRAFSLLEIE